LGFDEPLLRGAETRVAHEEHRSVRDLRGWSPIPSRYLAARLKPCPSDSS